MKEILKESVRQEEKRIAEELCDECFFGCEGLSRVTFGESSSLKLIGKEAFSRSGVGEIPIPDGVE